MEQPWKLAQPRLRFAPAHVTFVDSMERTRLDEAEAKLPDFDVIVGIGGGSCMDFAKYLAWKRRSRLVLIPSIVSVDACVTHLVAVRDGGRVRNIGHARADSLLIDFDLISAAPSRLNRAGAADILSIHTASFDWLLGHKKNGEAYDARIAVECHEVVAALEKSAVDIRAVNGEGIRKLVELFEAENDLCVELGNFRPEEGSEHFFAYNTEHLTGKHFIHGELVALGILLMSRLQNNKPDWVSALLTELSVLYRPNEIGLDAGELQEILLTLSRYCRSEQLPHTIIDEADLSPSTVNALISDLL
ncbi:iron-containing alcohol dehydrogenase [Candidatus Poribacteria bacterium]|nr:iron-containing alcohol dehydrogenase [Candidatus Poribacteria bacterium]